MVETIKIIIPKVATTQIEFDLIKLTKLIEKKTNKEAPQGFLGGSYAYGINYQNDTFLIHQFCWCENEGCAWCFGNAPNFSYNKGIFDVHWYKWIGRDTQLSKKITLKDWKIIMKDCLKSLRKIKG